MRNDELKKKPRLQIHHSSFRIHHYTWRVYCGGGEFGGNRCAVDGGESGGGVASGGDAGRGASGGVRPNPSADGVGLPLEGRGAPRAGVPSACEDDRRLLRRVGARGARTAHVRHAVDHRRPRDARLHALLRVAHVERLPAARLTPDHFREDRAAAASLEQKAVGRKAIGSQERAPRLPTALRPTAFCSSVVVALGVHFAERVLAADDDFDYFGGRVGDVKKSEVFVGDVLRLEYSVL